MSGRTIMLLGSLGKHHSGHSSITHSLELHHHTMVKHSALLTSILYCCQSLLCQHKFHQVITTANPCLPMHIPVQLRYCVPLYGVCLVIEPTQMLEVCCVAHLCFCFHLLPKVCVPSMCSCCMAGLIYCIAMHLHLIMVLKLQSPVI